MLSPGGTRSVIISLAHGLKLRTIAEGVETPEQLAFLQDAGCDFIQGYIFSRPLSVIDASRLLWQYTLSGISRGIPGSSLNPQLSPELLVRGASEFERASVGVTRSR